VSRLAQQVNVLEAQAARALLKVAETIEEACYYSEQAIPPGTVRAMHRAYRILKPVAKIYYGDNLPLCWDPPSYRFQKKESK
jgi:hypothetical protein